MISIRSTSFNGLSLIGRGALIFTGGGGCEGPASGGGEGGAKISTGTSSFGGSSSGNSCATSVTGSSTSMTVSSCSAGAGLGFGGLRISLGRCFFSPSCEEVPAAPTVEGGREGLIFKVIGNLAWLDEGALSTMIVPSSSGLSTDGDSIGLDFGGFIVSLIRRGPAAASLEGVGSGDWCERGVELIARWSRTSDLGVTPIKLKRKISGCVVA